MNAAKISEERITVKKWIIYGLTLAILGVGITGCSNILANVFASPTVSAAMTSRPPGTLQVKEIVPLTSPPQPSHLVVLAKTKTKATLAVYCWQKPAWHMCWSKSWLMGSQPKDYSSETLSYLGARQLMGGKTKELITNYLMEGPTGGSGEDQFTIWRWHHHALHAALILNGPWGSPISAIQRHHALLIKSWYYPNLNTCIACGQTASTVITYHDRRWTANHTTFFQELMHGIPTAPPPKPQPTVTFGSGFDDATFALTGVHSTFPAGTIVHWLLDDPSPFNTSSLNIQLYEQNGAAEQLMGSSTITTNPQVGEEEDSLSSSLAAGTYQLIVLIHNKVLASGTFTIG